MSKRNIPDIPDIPVSPDVESATLKKRKLQNPTATHWVFTWNNYPEDWQDYFNDRQDLIERICAEEEIGPKEGTPHIQGWLKLIEKRCAWTFLNLPKAVRFFIMKSTERKNIKYCTKDNGNALMWGITPPWTREIVNRQPYMDELITILKTPLEEGSAFRRVYWLWSIGGDIGKTVFQQWCHLNLKGVLPITGKAHDIRHSICEYANKLGYTPRIVFMNIPKCTDGEHISYAAIENAKDMFFASGKYKGGVVNGPRPHLMVFANDRPLTTKMSEDRWAIGQIIDGAIQWERPGQ